MGRIALLARPVTVSYTEARLTSLGHAHPAGETWVVDVADALPDVRKNWGPFVSGRCSYRSSRGHADPLCRCRTASNNRLPCA